MSDSNQWASWYEKTGKRIDEDIPKIEKIFKENSINKILDLGCGVGRHTIYFAAKGFRTYGLDKSKEAIDSLKMSLSESNLKSELKVADMEMGLPYDNKFFDAILAVRSIHHMYMNKMKKVVSEMERVMRSGGFIYVQVPTYDKLLKLKKDGESFKEIEPGTNVPLSGPEKGVVHHNFTKKELLDIFQNFEIRELYERDDHYCVIGNKK